MVSSFLAPGVTSTIDGNDFVIRIARERVEILIAILLHSKFSDGPQIECLASPYVNALLEALIAANGTSEYMAKREGMAEVLAPVVAFVEAWAQQNSLSGAEADALLNSAIFPYSLT